MGTTSEELKKLYKKLGGKDPKVAGFSSPGEILNAINEIPLPTEYELPTVTTEDAGDVLVVNEEGKWDKGEASGGLPEVTTDDNGDILQVVEGAWAKAAMSKDVVVISPCELSSGAAGISFPSGVTQKSIGNLLKDNKLVILRIKSGSAVEFAWPIFDTMQGNDFSFVLIRTNGISTRQWVRFPGSYYSDSSTMSRSWTNTSDTLPMASDNDNGKILQVVNGAWTKAAPSGGDIVVYTATQRNNSSYCDLDNGKTTTDIYNDIMAGKIVAIYVKNGLPKLFFHNEYHYYSSSDYYVFSSAYIHDNKPYIATIQVRRQDGSVTIMEIIEHRLALYSDIPTT